MSEPEPSYSATDLFSEFSDGWKIYWKQYLDGRYLVAEERFTDHPAVFARKDPAGLADCLREHEAQRSARG